MPFEPPPDLAERKKAIKDTLRCPYCDVKLEKIEVSESPLGGWDSPFLYLCMNDECPYHASSAEVLAEQGIPRGAYRLSWEPERDWCGPVAAPKTTQDDG